MPKITMYQTTGSFIWSIASPVVAVVLAVPISSAIVAHIMKQQLNVSAAPAATSVAARPYAPVAATSAASQPTASACEAPTGQPSSNQVSAATHPAQAPMQQPAPLQPQPKPVVAAQPQYITNNTANTVNYINNKNSNNVIDSYNTLLNKQDTTNTAIWYNRQDTTNTTVNNAINDSFNKNSFKVFNDNDAYNKSDNWSDQTADKDAGDSQPADPPQSNQNAAMMQSANDDQPNIADTTQPAPNNAADITPEANQDDQSQSTPTPPAQPANQPADGAKSADPASA